MIAGLATIPSYCRVPRICLRHLPFSVVNFLIWKRSVMQEVALHSSVSREPIDVSYNSPPLQDLPPAPPADRSSTASCPPATSPPPPNTDPTVPTPRPLQPPST